VYTVDSDATQTERWLSRVQTSGRQQVDQNIRVLLAGILSDFASLREAYAKAGILGETSAGSAHWRLPGSKEVARFQRNFLLLDSIIRHRVTRLAEAGDEYCHVAVFGGNNVGKSTVINILAKAPVASASPEGGHTRHAQAFVADKAELFRNSAFAFKPLSTSLDDEAAEDMAGGYKVSRLTSASLPADLVLWDTPDCDAVGSSRYLASAVEAVALADLVVYVTSVEKYAVEHIVDWVFQLHDAGLAIVECLNKTRRCDRGLVIRKQADTVFPTMSERLGLPCPTPPIVALRNLTEGDEEELWGPDHPEAEELRQTVFANARTADRSVQAVRALDFVRRRLGDALMPVRVEREARQSWEMAVESATAAFLSSYEQDYLASATVIDPFTRLNLEILKLLEPANADMRRALDLIRLPSRLILQVGRRLLSSHFSNGTDASGSTPAPEWKAYSDAHMALLDTLGLKIDAERSAACHHPFWDVLAECWPSQLNLLAEEFGNKVSEQMDATRRTIEAVARDIMEKLKEQPTLLAVLRGVRVTTSVGGSIVGLLLPHHGLVLDVLEPLVSQVAMASAVEGVTSYATQQFVEARKREIVDELKDRARDTARILYREPLLAFGATAMACAAPFDVDTDILQRLPKSLARLSELCGRG